MRFEDLKADFESHPITGYLHTGQRLSVPLISQITDNLFVGGFVHGVNLGDFFDHVFSLFVWEKYPTADGTNHVEVKMYDSHDVDSEAVLRYGKEVADAIRSGGKVLVHCQAGINRSNLIAATALVMLGSTPDEAIALLREKRSHLVLANKTFENFLRNELQDWLDANPRLLVE